MGMRACYSFLKVLFIIVNIILLLLGIAGIATGIWLLADPQFPVTLSQDQESNDYQISLVIILLSSIALVIISIMGIYGCLKEVKCPLFMFFSVILIILVAEIAACVWVYIYRESLETQIHSSMKLTVEEEYSQDANRKTLFDTFQEKLHCCGAEKPMDWMKNQELNLAVTNEPRRYNVPKSCCREGVSEEKCRESTENLKAGYELDYKYIYDQGCYAPIMSLMKDYAYTIVIVVVSVQFVGLILSLILAFSVNSSNPYKA